MSDGPRISRRDFLKLAALGAGALAARKPLEALLRATEADPHYSGKPTPKVVKEWLDYENQFRTGGLGTAAGVTAAIINPQHAAVKVALGAGVDLLTACGPKTPKPEGIEPTQDQKTEVTNQATALPEASRTPVATATAAPSQLELPVKTSQSQPSAIEGLYLGELDLKNGQPPTTWGTVDGYLTPINTLYRPESPNQTVAFGIDQEYLKKYFDAKTEGGVTTGDYYGTPITLKNGTWHASTGEVFIPFIKAGDPRGNIYQVIDANGKIQEVLEKPDKTVTLIGEARSMFETPPEAAYRLGFSGAKRTTEADMNRNGSISFVTKEARPTKENNNRAIKIVNEVSFLSEAVDLTKDSIVLASADRIAQEMTKKGTTITKEQLMQNGLEVKRITGTDKDGNQKNYDVVTIKTDGKAGYVLAILDRETGSSEKVDMNKTLDMIGINYDIYAAWDEDNKAAWEQWLKEGDTIVPDSASTQHSTDKYGVEFLNSYFKRTKENKQGYRMNSVFWDEADVSEKIKGETDPVKVEAFMRERLAMLMKLRPTEMNVILEPFDLIDGKFVWANTPWYKVYGEEWPVKAFQFAQEEAQKLKLTLGKDIKLYWNDWKLDQPGPKLDRTLEIIGKIIQSGFHIDGVGLQIYNGTNNKYYPHVPKKDELMTVMRNIESFALHPYVEYLVMRNPADTAALVPIGNEIFSACVEINRESPGTVSSMNIIDDYDPASPLDPNSFAFYNKVDYSPNMNYFELQAKMVDSLT